MAKVDPISATEDVFWRALMRIVLTLPRLLDGDLVRSAGMSFNAYLTLMSLSEAPGRGLRMSDLADATALSASRMTRVVDELESLGWVTKRASAEDRRGNVASLTPAGLAKLETAWAAHLSSARTLVFDKLEPSSSEDAARALAEIAVRLKNTH